MFHSEQLYEYQLKIVMIYFAVYINITIVFLYHILLLITKYESCEENLVEPPLDVHVVINV